ncbi:MAG: rhomboid family intramembrane serine protease [Pseudomonadota bacterium]
MSIAVEAVLQLSDFGLLPGRLRRIAYDSGGFWPGLLRSGWRPNYPAQPWTMFVTYGFLHGGASHLIVNMLTLWSLGVGVIERVGARGLLLLYLAALLGGGLGFGLLAATLQPMVGASGALFGLVGGLLAWAYVDRFTARLGLWPVARAVGFLVVLNLVLWWVMDGQLAWETHLGGFVTGWIAALLIDPRARAADAPPHSDREAAGP